MRERVHCLDVSEKYRDKGMCRLPEKNADLNVVSLFDYSGVMVQPWLDAGYTCWIVDVQHETGADGNLRRIRHDLSVPWFPPFDRGSIAFVAAFPPCDHLAVSGARWFKGKGLRSLSKSIELFATASEFCEWSGAPYLIENPVSSISTYYRKPDCIFHPYQYAGIEPGDNYTKKTCLWTGGGFVMPSPAPGNAPPDDRIHKCPPGPERKNFRSRTPSGFAMAVFEANRRSPIVDSRDYLAREAPMEEAAQRVRVAADQDR